MIAFKPWLAATGTAFLTGCTAAPPNRTMPKPPAVQLDDYRSMELDDLTFYCTSPTAEQVIPGAYSHWHGMEHADGVASDYFVDFTRFSTNTSFHISDQRGGDHRLTWNAPDACTQKVHQMRDQLIDAAVAMLEAVIRNPRARDFTVKPNVRIELFEDKATGEKNGGRYEIHWTAEGMDTNIYGEVNLKSRLVRFSVYERSADWSETRSPLLVADEVNASQVNLDIGQRFLDLAIRLKRKIR